MPNPVNAIEWKAVSKSFGNGGALAVDSVDISVRSGEFLALVGESGSGKSTLLKMVNRLVDPDQGKVNVDVGSDRPLDSVGLRRRIGYVVQGVGLLPHLSVARNVAIVPELLEVPRKEIDGRIDELLHLVGLEPASYRDRRASELSGGQAQRVGLARALAGRAPIVLMDEPFGALDPVTRGRLQSEYRAIHDRLGLTTVLVTHDLAEAALMADRVAVMRNGKVLRIGTPAQVWSNPIDEYVAKLVETPLRQATRLTALLDGASRDE